MKTITLTLAVALLCMCSQKNDAQTLETSKDISDSVPVRILNCAFDESGKQLIQISDEERQKLNAAAPVLEKLAASKLYKKIFWKSISDKTGAPPKPITWAEAEKRIRRGEFTMITQWHDRRLLMHTINYEEFTTTQERIDQASAIITEIDPKRVFIDYSTE